MNSEDQDQILFLTVIAGRKLKDDLLSAMSECGARLISTVYGRGTVKAGYLQNVLGLVPEENKVVIYSVMRSKKCEVIMKLLVDRFRFDKPNTGVAFTIPIDKVSF